MRLSFLTSSFFSASVAMPSRSRSFFASSGLSLIAFLRFGFFFSSSFPASTASEAASPALAPLAEDALISGISTVVKDTCLLISSPT